MFDFSNYSSKSKYHNDLNVLLVSKIKDITGGVATEEMFGWKQKMYSILVSHSSKYKKRVNKYVIAKIGHNEYKHILLNKFFKDIWWIEFIVKITE